MKKTYKVEVSEKEARGIGEGRWMGKNQWLYLALALLPIIALIPLVLLKLPDWAFLPLVWGLLGLTIHSMWEGGRLCGRAGKEFVQSLEKPKKGGKP